MVDSKLPGGSVLSVAILTIIRWLSSSGMLVVNKMAISKFKFTATLLLFQILLTVAVVFVAKQAGLIAVDKLEARKLQLWVPVVGIFMAMLLSSLKAMENGCTVETVIVFANLNTLAVLYGSWNFLRENVTRNVVLSLLVIIAGALIFSKGDLEFNAWGYGWLLVNTAATCSYNLYTKHTLNVIKFEAKPASWSAVWYNNVLSVPVLLAIMLWTGELAPAIAELKRMPSSGHLAIVISGVIGFSISYTGFWLQHLVSATTFTVLTNLNKIVSVIMSFFIFNTPLSTVSWIGLGVSLSGAYLYSWEKWSSEQKRA